MSSSKKKVLLSDYNSVIDKNLKFSEEGVTLSVEESDVVVNPSWGSMIGKEVVINNIGEFPIREMIENKNTVVSRFDMHPDIKKDPYQVPEKRKKCKKEDYCLCILTNEAMCDPDLVEDVHKNNYLVGICDTIGEDLTSVGVKLLMTEPDLD
jgi:hypothetical protein